MRATSACEHFNAIRVLDLHGNTTKVENGTRRVVEENVFDIRQGVSVARCFANSAADCIAV